MKKIFKLIPLIFISALGLVACDFNFMTIKVQEIAFDKTEITISPEETYELTTYISPSDATNQSLNWTTSNSAYVTVSNGIIKGVAVGNATITAKAKDGSGVSATCAVTVANSAVTGVTLSSSSIQLYVGGTSQLTANITPTYATNKNVTWSSDNSTKASVSTSGLVTGEAIGSTTIRVTTEDGNFSASCAVTVVAASEVVKTDLKSNYMDYVDNNVYNISSSPTVGQTKLLIIPIWFTDSSTYISSSKKANVKSDIETAYLGTTSATGWNSVKTYYETESASALTMTGTVSNWYECGNASSAYYTSSSNTTALVKTATSWYFTNNPSASRSDYDQDGNGWLDGVMLIYGAPDYQVLKNSSADNMWAYCYWIQDSSLKSASNPGPNVFFWASYDFMYDSSAASSRAGSSYGNGDCSHCNVDAHTFIHEMGHVLGLDDYYDYSSQYNPAGGFSMQDYNVGGHDPFSVMAYGWADPYIPTSSCSITIKNFQSSHDVILLTPSWNSYDSPFDEYLLLELYTPTGLNLFDSTYTYTSNYPKGPSTPGIRLWHVDARLAYTSTGTYSSSKLTTNPNISTASVTTAMSNTYYGSEGSDYISVLGQSYANYNLLQLIRNSTSATYQPEDNLSSSSLFKAGSSFSMPSYSGQFVNSTNLNNGKALGWTFSVTSLSATSATINLTKVS